MPTRNIYVSESNLELWDRAKAELDGSLSSIFMDCLERNLGVRSSLDESPVDLSGLKTISEKLNGASNRLSNELAAVEESLNELNLGIEVRVPEPLEKLPDRASYLCYGKLAKNWCLYVSYELEGEKQAVMRERPLLQSSRETRQRARQHLPELIRALEAEASQLLEGLD